MTAKIISLYILLIPFDNYRILPISLSNVVLCLAIPIFLMEMYSGRNTLKVLYFKISLPIYVGILYIIVLTSIMVLLDPVNEMSRMKDISFSILILIFLIIASFTISANRSYDDYNTLIKMLLASCIISTSLGYYDYIHFFFTGDYYWDNPEILRWNEKIISPYLIRMTGSYFDPNYFSLIPAIGLSSTLVVVKKKTWRLILFMFFLLALILTFSRMAYLAVFIFFILHLLKKNRAKWLKQLIIIGLPILFIALIPLTVKNFQRMNRQSINERTIIFKESVKLFVKRPVFGYGLGERVESSRYMPGTSRFRETHNTVLQVLLYGGIIYFSLILFPFLFYIYKLLISHPRSSEATLIKDLLINILPFVLLGVAFLSYLNIKYFWLIYFLIIEFVYNYNLEKRENNFSALGK